MIYVIDEMAYALPARLFLLAALDLLLSRRRVPRWPVLAGAGVLLCCAGSMLRTMLWYAPFDSSAYILWELVLACLLSFLLFRGDLCRRLAGVTFLVAVQFFAEAFLEETCSIVFHGKAPFSGDPCILAELLLLALALALSLILRRRKRNPPSALPLPFLLPSLVAISAMAAIPLMSHNYYHDWSYSLCFLAVAAVQFSVLLACSLYAKSAQLTASLKEQHRAYERQFALIEEHQRQVRAFRHDMENHLLALGRMAEERRDDAILDYIGSARAQLAPPGGFLDTGNPELDALINYKLTQAQKRGIRAEAAAALPARLGLSAYDLNILLGNLLDNAIRAAQAAEPKVLRLSIEYDRGVLYVSLSNSFDPGALAERDGVLKTTKADPARHGIGLDNAERICQKYNGQLSHRTQGGQFITELSLYI